MNATLPSRKERQTVGGLLVCVLRVCGAQRSSPGALGRRRGSRGRPTVRNWEGPWLAGEKSLECAFSASVGSRVKV